MVELNISLTRVIVIVFFWILQFVIGYLAFSLLMEHTSFLATADIIEDKCHDCRLTSSSVDELTRRPRQMNSYGQVGDRIDLEKIKKAVCKEYHNDGDREKCRNFYFTQQASVLRWKQSSSKASFFDFVCIKDLKVCCPERSFGQKCTKCSKCNTNEFCHGEGTRSGNGTCICKAGHAGQDCSVCLKGFYMDKSHSNPSGGKTACEKCHRSCEQCRGPGPTKCDVCKSGFTWEPSYGCVDIDECIRSKNKICGENTFCVNTEGSYFCYECDRACDGCHGDGPDMCLRCAKGYQLEQGNCIALKKTILPPEANYYRYAIYVGLCVCTCIILHNSVYLASFVGLLVAMYIGFSEYVMSNHESNLATKS
ncbi:uncharacterized protein LOC143868531 [Tasmannia lanceolata]|uniref:uncharacterized protein LOC143868531 n=1 Tax=Tasmannia lanceolata TaxID=3420 RepID=UPI004064575D